MKYKAVLFDMDGVIVDSEPNHIAAFQSVLKDHGKDLSVDGYKEFFAGRTDEDGFNRYFQSVNEPFDLESIMVEKTSAYVNLCSVGVQGYPSIVERLKDLSASHRLGLVSGSSMKEVQMTLAALGITDCFEVVVSADDISRSKPDPEGYQKAVRALGLNNKDCVIVEDSPSGVQAGTAAGIDVIAVTHTHSAKELSQADVVAERLSVDLF